MRLGVPDAEQLVAFGGLGLGDLGIRVARGGVDALAEVLAEPPLGGVLGGNGLDDDVLDAGDVVDPSAAVVGEAENPLVELEAAQGGGASDVTQDQVKGALLAALEP
ncbi:MULTISPECIES: hypothetical protein [unclassified Streptomyces]|uniref:hypothetical protein n=1 Tax=unclassified Streptomyces TaxID=2593676 RepID=UPI00382C8903